MNELIWRLMFSTPEVPERATFEYIRYLEEECETLRNERDLAVAFNDYLTGRGTCSCD